MERKKFREYLKRLKDFNLKYEEVRFEMERVENQEKQMIIFKQVKLF